MHLDIRTVIFITAVTQAFYSAGMYLISRSWIKSPALNRVALAFACGSIGGFLISFRGSIHPFLSIVIANVFVLANPILIFEGVQRFRRVRSRFCYVGPVFLALIVPILSYATFIQPHLSTRIFVMSLTFGIMTLLCAYLLVNNIDRALTFPAYVTAFFFVFATVIMSTRTALVLFQSEVPDFMASGNSQSLLQLSHIVYITGVAFGFIWLNTRKLGLNLVTALQDVDNGIHRQLNFIDVMAHELKTPLATIQNSTESLFIRSEQQMNPAKERAFERIYRSLDRLDEIIETGLKQKLLHSDHILNAATLVSIPELLQTSAEVCKGVFPDHRVSIKFHPSCTGQTDILADGNSLLTALNNILENAMKYSPANINIQVEIGQSDEMLTLTIKDRGRGLERDEPERFFAKDFRGKNAATVAGSGLGLFIVQHIIKAHHGTVAIRNRKSGGCRVDVCLPFTHDTNDQKLNTCSAL